MKLDTDTFRSAEPEDFDILRRYAVLKQLEKNSKEEADSLRDQVFQILAREDTEKTLVHKDFLFEVQYRRKWNPRMNQIDREIDIDGQFVQASIKSLKDATTRLTKLLQTPEMEDGHTIAITSKML